MTIEDKNTMAVSNSKQTNKKQRKTHRQRNSENSKQNRGRVKTTVRNRLGKSQRNVIKLDQIKQNMRVKVSIAAKIEIKGLILKYGLGKSFVICVAYTG